MRRTSLTNARSLPGLAGQDHRHVVKCVQPAVDSRGVVIRSSVTRIDYTTRPGTFRHATNTQHDYRLGRDRVMSVVTAAEYVLVPGTQVTVHMVRAHTESCRIEDRHGSDVARDQDVYVTWGVPDWRSFMLAGQARTQHGERSIGTRVVACRARHTSLKAGMRLVTTTTPGTHSTLLTFKRYVSCRIEIWPDYRSGTQERCRWKNRWCPPVRCPVHGSVEMCLVWRHRLKLDSRHKDHHRSHDRT